MGRSFRRSVSSASRGQISRRVLLGVAFATFMASATKRAAAAIFKGIPLWTPFAYSPPETVNGDGWHFFTEAEAETVEAIVARLIPADELSVSGKDAGCAVFIDRQLAGAFGSYQNLYMKGPFHPGTPQQGDQSDLTPRQRYRMGLAALEKYCQDAEKQSFAKLPPGKQDEILTKLQKAQIALDGIGAETFFMTIHRNTIEGFFADPIYGGNRDMASWKMLGFPGARYDYRDYVDKHNQKLDIPPLSIEGRAGWRVRT